MKEQLDSKILICFDVIKKEKKIIYTNLHSLQADEYYNQAVEHQVDVGAEGKNNIILKVINDSVVYTVNFSSNTNHK